MKNCRSSSLTVRKGEEGDCRLLCTTCDMAESPFDVAFCCWRMEPLVLILWAKRQVSEIIANGGLSWLCGFEMRFGRTERRKAQKGINLYYTKMASPLAVSLHKGRRRNIHSRFANGKKYFLLLYVILNARTAQSQSVQRKLEAILLKSHTHTCRRFLRVFKKKKHLPRRERMKRIHEILLLSCVRTFIVPRERTALSHSHLPVPR